MVVVLENDSVVVEAMVTTGFVVVSVEISADVDVEVSPDDIVSVVANVVVTVTTFDVVVVGVEPEPVHGMGWHLREKSQTHCELWAHWVCSSSTHGDCPGCRALVHEPTPLLSLGNQAQPDLKNDEQDIWS